MKTHVSSNYAVLPRVHIVHPSIVHTPRTHSWHWAKVPEAKSMDGTPKMQDCTRLDRRTCSICQRRPQKA